MMPPSLTCLEDLLSLFSTLSKAHLGYLHLVRAFLSVHLLFLCGATQACCTQWRPLWERVWITLNLAERWWWLSHCKYWSVCVGFLYTVIDREPSTSGLTIVSKKGMDPSSLLSSTVNLMAGSTLLMCWKEALFIGFLVDDKGSSNNLHQNLGGWGQCLELFVLSTPCREWPKWG